MNIHVHSSMPVLPVRRVLQMNIVTRRREGAKVQSAVISGNDLLFRIAGRGLLMQFKCASLSQNTIGQGATKAPNHFYPPFQELPKSGVPLLSTCSTSVKSKNKSRKLENTANACQAFQFFYDLEDDALLCV